MKEPKLRLNESGLENMINKKDLLLSIPIKCIFLNSIIGTSLLSVLET